MHGDGPGRGGLANEGLRAMPGGDLVLIALPRVKRFVAEARSAADVRAANEIFAGLAARTADARREAGGERVTPERNRVMVALTGLSGGISWLKS
jgi:hypothetical protein